MVFITGTVPSVPVSIEARYSERVLAQSAHRPSRVHPSKLDQLEDGPRSPNVNRMQCLSRVPPPKAAQQVVCVKSRAPPQLRVADQHTYMHVGFAINVIQTAEYKIYMRIKKRTVSSS